MHEARNSKETSLVGDVAESRAEASGNQGAGGEESVLVDLMHAVVIDSAHEARNVAKSRAEASGNQGGGEESVLLETAAVGVTAPVEQMAPALGRDEAPMAHDASAARGDELDAEQSVPLPAGCSVSRELEGRNDSGDTKAKETLVKEVRAAIKSSNQNLLFAADVNSLTLLYWAAWYRLVHPVQQLIKAGGKKLLFATYKKGWSVLHCTSNNDRVEVVLLLIEEGGKKLVLMTDCGGHSELHVAASKGHVECMQQLMEAGGIELVLLRNKQRGTALHLAADKGCETATLMLIKAGGKKLLLRTDVEGGSALHVAARSLRFLWGTMEHQLFTVLPKSDMRRQCGC